MSPCTKRRWCRWARALSSWRITRAACPSLMGQWGDTRRPSSPPCSSSAEQKLQTCGEQEAHLAPAAQYSCTPGSSSAEQHQGPLVSRECPWHLLCRTAIPSVREARGGCQNSTLQRLCWGCWPCRPLQGALQSLAALYPRQQVDPSSPHPGLFKAPHQLNSTDWPPYACRTAVVTAQPCSPDAPPVTRYRRSSACRTSFRPRMWGWLPRMCRMATSFCSSWKCSR